MIHSLLQGNQSIVVFSS
ncbi:hypothetical protein KM1_237260 [Entamoeba histolytica HM-3:IMSS]|nr:hypothetical protein KM1_237260 [Entamoeba histolytica HM-3:IMSS]